VKSRLGTNGTLAPQPDARQAAWDALATWLTTARALMLYLERSARDIANDVRDNPDGEFGQIISRDQVSDLMAFAAQIGDVDSHLCNITFAPPVALPDPLASVKGGA
jgi:hypothetical protein